MSNQTAQTAPDPMRTLLDTRRTLLALVAKIDAEIAAAKESARTGR